MIVDIQFHIVLIDILLSGWSDIRIYYVWFLVPTSVNSSLIHGLLRLWRIKIKSSSETFKNVYEEINLSQVKVLVAQSIQNTSDVFVLYLMLSHANSQTFVWETGTQR